MPVLPLIVVAATAVPIAHQDVAALDARVVEATGAAVGEPGGAATAIDRRLRLAACPAAVTVVPMGSAALALRCEPLGWRIRVPLVAAATTSRAVAAPVIRRGDLVAVSVRGAGFEVTTEATAIEDGYAGRAFRLRRDASPPKTAIAVAPGRAVLGH